MKRPDVFAIVTIIMLWFIPAVCGGEVRSEESALALPDIPRISAVEAYQLFKQGRAIIIDASEQSGKSQIVGAIAINGEDVTSGRVPLPAFPMEGIQILTFCF